MVCREREESEVVGRVGGVKEGEGHGSASLVKEEFATQAAVDEAVAEGFAPEASELLVGLMFLDLVEF